MDCYDSIYCCGECNECEFFGELCAKPAPIPVTLYRAQGHTVLEVGDRAAILPWPWEGMEPGEKREMVLVDKPGQS